MLQWLSINKPLAAFLSTLNIQFKEAWPVQPQLYITVDVSPEFVYNL